MYLFCHCPTLGPNLSSEIQSQPPNWPLCFWLPSGPIPLVIWVLFPKHCHSLSVSSGSPGGLQPSPLSARMLSSLHLGLFANPVSPSAHQHFPFVSTSRPTSFYISLNQFILLLESILLHSTFFDNVFLSLKVQCKFSMKPLMILDLH